MDNTKTASEQLASAVKAAEEAVARVAALKAQSREEDLQTTKTLITTHGFTAKDLKPELATTGTTTRRTTTARKSTVRKPRKS